VSIACADARRVARVRVVCPRLIPDIPLTRIDGLWGVLSGREEPRLWMVTFTNAGGLHGRPLKGVEHRIVGGGKTEVVEKWVLSGVLHEVKGDAVPSRTVNARGRRVRLYRFPSYPAGGPNGGHWAAFVDVGDEVVFASLHGERYVDAAVEMAVDLAAQVAIRLTARPQVGVLRMAAGHAIARFQIMALAPPKHSFDVRVVAPASADIGVRIRTWYGQALRVLDSTRDRGSCRVRRKRSVCSLAFPRLEAQRAGCWTVIATKRSRPPALVRIAVIFNRD
jgi:hypothetical protein